MRHINSTQECTLEGTLFSTLSKTYLPLHRIIPFSNVEGQGNRTSIFLQGCELNCLYCHNPETIHRYATGAKDVTLLYLYQQIQNALPFIRGITVSGGEPTIHHQKLIPLFRAVKSLGLTCYLDTAGFFEFERMQELVLLTDKFLFDLKGDGIGLHTLCFDRKNKAGLAPLSTHIKFPSKLTTKVLERNLKNLQKLLQLNKIEEVRLVVINHFFDAEHLIDKVAKLISPYPDVILKLIRVHTKGTRDPQGLETFLPSTDQINQLAQRALQLGIRKVVKIY